MEPTVELEVRTSPRAVFDLLDTVGTMAGENGVRLGMIAMALCVICKFLGLSKDDVLDLVGTCFDDEMVDKILAASGESVHGKRQH